MLILDKVCSGDLLAVLPKQTWTGNSLLHTKGKQFVTKNRNMLDRHTFIARKVRPRETETNPTKKLAWAGSSGIAQNLSRKNSNNSWKLGWNRAQNGGALVTWIDGQTDIGWIIRFSYLYSIYVVKKFGQKSDQIWHSHSFDEELYTDFLFRDCFKEKIKIDMNFSNQKEYNKNKCS